MCCQSVFPGFVVPRNARCRASHQKRATFAVALFVSDLTGNESQPSASASALSSMMMDQQQIAQHDPIQLNLDAVTRRLVRPGFLSNLTPSRLPSQAASEASLSPTAPHPLTSEARSHHRGQSHLHVVTFEDVLEKADLISPLIQEPYADGSSPSVEQRVHHHLEKHFIGARRAYASMASERNFTTFAHGHHDLVLAVDFNYFGTRMVTSSSDHRLKVWDKKDDSWSLVESWKAHDAEIVDVSSPLFIYFQPNPDSGSRHLHDRFATSYRLVYRL